METLVSVFPKPCTSLYSRRDYPEFGLPVVIDLKQKTQPLCKSWIPARCIETKNVIKIPAHAQIRCSKVV